MRRIILVALTLMISMGLNAQKLRNSDIPQEVRLGLENTYSDYKLQGWYFETGQYVAEISIDKDMEEYYSPLINLKFDNNTLTFNEISKTP